VGAARGRAIPQAEHVVSRRWAPAIALWVGVVASLALRGERRIPLLAPLDSAVSDTLDGYVARHLPLSKAELTVARPTSYLFRSYETPRDSTPGHFFTVYVGYYEEQTQGRTIHSPKNCLPGAGWEPLSSDTVTLATPAGGVTVNRYLLQLHNQRALVLYWYQGRGRVAANEYLVKWQLLRDSALRRRSDDAVVRVMVPVVGGNQEAAFALAAKVATRLVPALSNALPS